MYTCTYCKKSYVKKGFYDRHVRSCEMLHVSRKDRKELLETLKETPNINDMYMLFHTLSQKVYKLEEEVDTMKRYITNSQKKISVLDWLKNSFGVPNTTFDIIMDIKNIIVTEEHLKFSLENSVADAVIEIFKEKFKGNWDELAIESKTPPPIISFQHSAKVFYIYSEESWKRYNYPEFEGLCLYIIRQLKELFAPWWISVIQSALSNPEYFKEIKTKTKAFNTTTDDKNITKTVRNIRMKLFKFYKVTIPTFIEKSEERSNDVKENVDDKIPVT